MHVSLFEIPPKTQKPDGYGTGNSLVKMQVGAIPIQVFTSSMKSI